MQHCRCTSSSLWFVALAVLVGITAVASNADAQVSYQVVAAFDRPNSSGANPSGGLIQGPDGNYYGTASQGGAAGYGTVFKIDAVGTVTTLHSFNYSTDGAYPTSGLTQARDGSIYGSTYMGGATGNGTIFKIDATGTLTTLIASTASP